MHIPSILLKKKTNKQRMPALPFSQLKCEGFKKVTD